MLETLYSTGIRRLEIINLTLYDVDYDRGTGMVREGKGDADRMVRFIQAFLGHARLQTTEIYTQVSIRQLKAIHAAYHAAAKLKRPEKAPESSRPDNTGG